MVPELDIRNAIVSLIQGVSGAGRVYNRLRKPPSALLSEFTDLNVDDAARINVVFVRRVSFVEQASSFDDPLSSAEAYEIWFYRGVVDATDGTDSESALQLFIENVRAALRLDANRHLSVSSPGFLVSQGGLGTAAPLIDTDELGGYDCHRFIGRLIVSTEPC
jgi:hypothetical protein